MENKCDEVIYISSDDDEDAIQNNLASKQRTVVEQKKLEDNSISYAKVEVCSSDCKKIGLSGGKRKISEISCDDEASSKKRIKLYDCKGENIVKACNVRKKGEEEEESEKKGEIDKTLLKPKLVVKEKKTISPVVQDIFPMFISLCLQKDRSEDMKVIVNKLKRRYEQLNPEYANSEVFINFLNEKRNDIMNSKHKLYIHISEVMNEMKNSCKGKSLLSLNNCSSGANKLNKSNSNASSVLCAEKLYVSNSVLNDSKVMMDNGEEQKKQRAIQRKIKIILKTMRKCEKCIKKLEEAEVDFDDDNNSNYIKLEKYKYRMVQLYNKYCEYTGENADAGRQYLRPKHFSTTGIVAVDHAITSFINSKISKRSKLPKKQGTFTDALIFPDYTDILKCITTCNELHNLGLNIKKQQQIAKKAFTELGEYLQRCRRNDYWDTFSLFLENKQDDPALKDPTLAEKLVQNKVEGEKKLSNVFQEYVKKQEEIKDRVSESKTSSENEEDEEDSMENEDQNEGNEVDEPSEIDTNFPIDKDKTSSDEEENSNDGCETPKGKANAKIESNMEKDSSDTIEIKDTQQTKSSNKLKAKVTDELRPAEMVDTDNTSICKTNLESKSIKENDAISLPVATQQLSSLPNIISPAVTDSINSISRAKEDAPSIVGNNGMDDKPLEEKAEEQEEQEKPLLRVRSFAKPPTTWKDVQEKVDKDEDKSKTLTDKDVIDLTQDSPKGNSTVRQCATIQIGSKVLPIVKGNYKTLVIPAGKSIINVKNITNNYVRLNTKNRDSSNMGKLENGQIISTQRVVSKNAKGTTVNLSMNLNANQNMNTNNQPQYTQAKQKSTTEQIIQSNQITVLPVKRRESTLQRSKTSSSTSQSK